MKNLITCIIIVMLFVSPLVFAAEIFKWEAPTTDTLGNPLTDLAFYRLACGTESGAYTVTYDTLNAENVSAKICEVLEDQKGDKYCTVYAVDTSGNVSDPSNEVTLSGSDYDCVAPSSCTDFRAE